MESANISPGTSESGYDVGSLVLGKWEIVESIGEGSFGKVFKIRRRDGLLEETSALKVITVPRSDAELRSLMDSGMNTVQAKEYLEGVANNVVREINIMSKLKGTSNIVSYEDCEKIPHANGIGWDILIRMELLHPLLNYAYENPLSRRDIIKLGIDICRALELCQKYNIIHRDVKPENVFVSENGDFKLGDFGISKSFEQTTAASTRIGTCNYMAPEVFRGEKYSFSVDIYSLGIVLYRLLNKNRLPFLPVPPKGILPSDQEAAFAKRIAGNPVPPPYYSQGRLPEIVQKACAPNAKDRYTSPMQMRQELEAILYEQSDSEFIYPDGDTLENLREYYASQRSLSEKNMSASGKTEDIFVDDTRTELIAPKEIDQPEEKPDDSETPEGRRLLIGILTAACVCAAAVAIAMFAMLRGRNATDPVSVPEPPSQTLPVEIPPSVPVPQLPEPTQVTSEADFVIEDGVLASYVGSGGDVVIPNSVTSIGFAAFQGCTGLTSVVIPDSVTSIESFAFNGCESLTSVVIPDSVTSIGIWAFNGCESLTSVVIPNSVTSIESSVFQDCTGLTSVDIPNSVTSIESFAFNGCESLTSVDIPDSVTSIGGAAFQGCTGLTSVAIPDSVTSIESSAFQDCVGLTSLVIPNSVTSIGGWAFSGCESLTSVTIPNSVTSIESSAFQDCVGLTSLAIPNSVTSIESFAFYGCTELKDVYYAGTQAQWEAIVIRSINDPLISAAIHYNAGT